ncbi:MAG: UDP-N-acetylmuramoyl-tripeptide--D-alanyl-D-alanine ligase [Leeuwenhoekiella sp.]
MSVSTEKLHKLFLASNGVCTDTRKLKPGQLFFALSGENFNGNKFAKTALEIGANQAIIDDAEYTDGDQMILVESTLGTLQRLAHFHRKYLALPILALTGSNGKTTTKELFNAVLSRKFKTVATQGNLNNHIGVPLTLLRMNEETDLGIVEMGANHLKEIEALTAIAEPDFGYITNYGKAHLEGFGGVEGIIKGKSELYASLRERGKTAIVNGDDAKQLEMANGIEQFVFGSHSSANVQVKYGDTAPFVSVEVAGHEIKSKLIGQYNAVNIAAAAAVGLYFKVPVGQIQQAIADYVPQNNRSQLITLGSATIILDAYNANPTSMEAALNNLEVTPATRKIAVLGDMFELGLDAEIEHQSIVDLATAKGLDKVFLLGENFIKTNVCSETIEKYSDFDAFAEAYPKEKLEALLEGSTVLIKGSRGMALERILKILD